MIGYLIVGVVVLLGLFLVWKMYFPKREGFQDVAGGVKVKASKEMCEKLKAHIEQHKQLRIDHPDTEIHNLNETLEQMNQYYTTYGCDTY